MKSVNEGLLSLHEALVKGESLGRIIERARRLFGNPVYAANCNLETAGYSREKEVNDTTWDRLVSSDLGQHFEQERITSESGINLETRDLQEPYIIDNPVMEHRILTANIRWKGNLIGYVMVFEIFRPFTEEDLQLMQGFSRILGFQIANSQEMRIAMHPGSELVIQELLAGKKLPEELIERGLFKNRADMQYLAAVISRQEGEPYLLNMLTYEFRNLRAVEGNGRIIAVIQVSEGAEKTAENQQFIERFQQFVQARKLHAGLSKPFYQLLQLKEYYEQAVTACEMGRDEPVTRYEDVAVLHLLKTAGETADLRNFTDPSVERLLRYDARYQTGWFGTLAAYLYCGGDVRKTAELLEIHKNTAHYRIGRIEEITGRQLTDSQLLFRLKLSVNILYYLDPGNFHSTYGVSEAVCMPFV